MKREMEIIDGQRVTLVPAEFTKAVDLLAVMRPEYAQNFAFFQTPLDLARQEAWLRRMTEGKSDFLWVIENKTNGKIIGTCGLHEYDENNNNARLGILIFDQRNRGQGLGKEIIRMLLNYAFTRFNLHKVYVRVIESNTEKQFYYAKIGFTIEGTLRQEYLLNGKYHNVVLLSILRPDWGAMSN